MCIWASKLFIRHQFLFVYLYSYIPTLRLDPQKIACGRCGAFIELLNTILLIGFLNILHFDLRLSMKIKVAPLGEKACHAHGFCIRSSVGITNYGSDNNNKKCVSCVCVFRNVFCPYYRYTM
uniref:Uncharacterized protein n=1 Tax=Cacopsylla melanoneura TaxID=428564 RepID=A0A8D8QY27_9HEMI